MELVEENASGLSGRIEIDFQRFTEDIEISVIPRFLSWRLERLRALWYEQDWPEDPYTEGAERRLPIIDPDVITPDDMRHPGAGSPAFDRWQERRTEVDGILANLQTAREANGLEHILKQVLGDPLPDLAALLTNLQQGTQLEETVNAITALFLTVESFTRLMEIKGKNDAGEPVTDAEWNEVYAILAQAEKLKRFPDWIAEEAGLVLGPKEFWIAAEEPELRKWLALPETRQGWQQALRNHSQPPIIDPDLIGPAYLRDPFAGDAAGLWQARRAFIDTQLASIRSAREAEANPRDGFNVILQNTLGVSSDELRDLAEQRDQGNDITGRLDQLSLSNEAFANLIRVQRLLASSAPDEDPLLPSEWEDVYSVLTQVLKRREFAAWREEERGQGITLSSDYFKIPNPPALEFPPREPEPLPAGRATEAALRSWRDALQSRIELEKSVIEALQAAVSATEEATLPLLRDALVEATNVEGIGLEAKAKAITDQLLIDAKAGGCQTTTRIAQALETLQILIWSVKTGQLADTYPDLVLDADNFDEEWNWLGAYNTWRAAMLVFLYPENILLPNLRKWQTPAFKKLVEELRANPRLTPEQACVVAKAYSDYFYDVCHLTLEASCQTRTRNHKGESCRDRSAVEPRSLFYMFARGDRTNKVYWSAYDPKDESGYAQTFWEAIPALENVINILGAVPYQITPEERFIFLFAQTQEADTQKLVFTTYNLEEQRWTGDIVELEVPGKATKFSAVIEQRDNELESPHIAIHVEGHGVFSGGLNQVGTGWEAAEPSLVSNDLSVRKVCSLIGYVGLGISYLLFVRTHKDELRVGSFLKLRPDVPILSWSTIGVGSWIGAFQYPNTLEFYVYLRDNSRVRYGRFRPADLGRPITLAFSGLVGLEQIAVHNGQEPELSGRRLAYRKRVEQVARLPNSGIPLNFRSIFTQRDDDRLDETGPTLIAPRVSGPFDLTERRSAEKLQLLRMLIAQQFEFNKAGPKSNLTYLEEAYYFVPVHLALQLRQRGQYLSALDWFRTVYDYGMREDVRKIYYGLEIEESLPEVYTRAKDWLLDPLNPHAIAATRVNAYTRFTLASLVGCFLEFADAEFTRDTAESVARARTLYMTALELLEAKELTEGLGECDDEILDVDNAVARALDVSAPEWIPVWRELTLEFRRIADSKTLAIVIEGIKATLITEEPVQRRLTNARDLIADARNSLASPPTMESVIAERADRTAKVHAALVAQPIVADALIPINQAAEDDYLHTVSLVTGINTEKLEREPVEWLRQPIASCNDWWRHSQHGEKWSRDYRRARRHTEHGVESSCADSYGSSSSTRSRRPLTRRERRQES